MDSSNITIGHHKLENYIQLDILYYTLQLSIIIREQNYSEN